MKHKLVVGFCGINLIGLIILFILHFSKKERVGYIDSTKVINSYQGMLVARKEYQGKVAIWKANIDTLASEIQKNISLYKTESLKMTAREKELSKELIDTKQQQLAEYQRAVNEKAGQEDAITTKKVVDEINAFIKDYGERHNYTIVFAATEYGNIAYAENSLDITEEIIEGLNNKYGGKSMK